MLYLYHDSEFDVNPSDFIQINTRISVNAYTRNYVELILSIIQV